MHPPCTYHCPEYEQAATTGCAARRDRLQAHGWNFYSNEGPLAPSSSSYSAQQRQDPADAQPCGQHMVTVLALREPLQHVQSHLYEMKQTFGR